MKKVRLGARFVNLESTSEIPKGEALLFFKQFLKQPFQLGTLSPISLRLADLAASCVKNPATSRIVEIGSGPGRLTRALFKRGVSPENFKAIELDPTLCAFAKKTLPQADIIQGDAQDLLSILPPEWIGTVDTVISTIPFTYLTNRVRAHICEAVFSVLKPEGEFLHLTYKWKSPLQEDYTQHLRASLWLNFPPGFIWQYALKSNT